MRIYNGVTALLKYSSYRIEFTQVKCTVEWFVDIQSCTAITTILTFPSPKEKPPTYKQSPPTDPNSASLYHYCVPFHCRMLF